MRMHNSDTDGNIRLTPAQAEGLRDWLTRSLAEGRPERNCYPLPPDGAEWSGGGVFLNYDHDKSVLIVDDGADPDQIDIGGAVEVYS